MEEAKEWYADPYGLYSSWLKGVEKKLDASQAEQTQKANPSPDQDAHETWQKWFEAMNATWRSSFAESSDPLGLTTRWLAMIEQTGLKLLEGVTPPLDPFTVFKQWYESSNQAWSKALEEMMKSEKFIEEASRSLESYTSFYKTFRRLNEDFFSHLQLTTRADLARVAEIIIGLENKVDWIQDAFEDFQGLYPQFATLESTRLLTDHVENLEYILVNVSDTLRKLDAFEGLSQRLSGVEGKLEDLPLHIQGVESKLEQFPSRFQKVEEKLEALPSRFQDVESKLEQLPLQFQKSSAIQGLEQRLANVESKLDALPKTVEKFSAIGNLETRLDGVEGKLDQLLTLITQQNSHLSSPLSPLSDVQATPVRAPQRKTAKAKTTSQKASTTESS